MFARTGALLGALTASASAQPLIDPANAAAWSENGGWTNWTGAGDGSQSVLLLPAGAPGFLAGHVWCENLGFLSLGDGTPANGIAYANTTGADVGVNILPGGNLSGLAWGENVGWVNFGTDGTLGAFDQQARFDAGAGRFRGYAWGENTGWINLDNAAHYVGVTGAACPADFNNDGGIDGADVEAFFAAWEAGDPNSDVNSDGGIDGADVESFFAAWEAGGC